MTENKIKPTIEQVIHCLKAESERYPELCEECQLYGKVGCDHCYDDVTDVAIKYIKELEQYRAIGTVEEFKELKEKNEPKKIIAKRKTTSYLGTDYYCPACDKRQLTAYAMQRGDDFCKDCGQKLDWS